MNKVCTVCGKTFEKPTHDSRRTWENRQCCSYPCSVELRRGRPNPKASAALKGRKHSAESNAKRSATIRRLHAEGQLRNARANLGKRGPETSQWKGGDISYRTAHARLRNERGRPGACELCGKTEGWLEWALSNDADIVKTQVGGTGDGLSYSTDPGDYFGTCRRCHREYDGRERDPLTGRYI